MLVSKGNFVDAPAPAGVPPTLALLCGGFPPQIDGIGDYTWNPSRELVAQGCSAVQVLTSTHSSDENEILPRSAAGLFSASADAEITVTRCFDPERPATLRSLRNHLTPGLDWLVVQYNPFGFGPRGFNPWLIAALGELRGCIRVAVMFHETYVPAWPWKFTAMRFW